MYELMKEDLDWFEIRKKWHLENGSDLQEAVRLAADEVVERIYGCSNEEAKAMVFFWGVMQAQEILKSGVEVEVME